MLLKQGIQAIKVDDENVHLHILSEQHRRINKHLYRRVQEVHRKELPQEVNYLNHQHPNQYFHWCSTFQPLLFSLCGCNGPKDKKKGP